MESETFFKMNSNLFLYWTLLLTCIIYSHGLRITKLEVPQSVPLGKSVTLRCHYDLEGDELYSVKWYKDYVEFYRYLPSNGPKSGQKFVLKGVHVDLSRSSAKHAFLVKTELTSEGHYACEVSTEGPSFSTVRAERQMKVYVLPKEGLSIEGSEPVYGMENHINLTCIANPSYPPQSLTWHINEQKALPHQLIQYEPETDSQELNATRLGLFFKATGNYFLRGALKLRCTSTITLVYRYESSITLSGGTPKNRTFNGHYTWNEDRLYQREPESPIIEGGKTKYKVGSIMDLNCTTTSESHLKWFIKNKSANESQLVRYTDRSGKLVKLGLRFEMEKRHFQMQELRLKCIAQYNIPIANFSKSLTIRTYERDDGLIIQPSIDIINHSISTFRKDSSSWLTIIAVHLLIWLSSFGEIHYKS
ncbi:uncharacterized protein LOC107362271 [Tetranychus urticae]|uniref:Ig-like domain-containing protein n=1 Tax=Tetranychus urticae TaxID=32264 RepID=T1KBL6_TETUR|nr:uncharacterized protein LOC107362271 [Tetranychus urticae]